MTLTIDELCDLFGQASRVEYERWLYTGKPGGIAPTIQMRRAGIIAIVKALRDEILENIEPKKIECCGKGVPNQDNTAEECCCSPDIWMHDQQLRDFFNEILATGEARQAGVLAVESREVATVPEATEAPAAAPAPVNVAKMQRTLLRKWRKTHSNPAPAVCEWVDVGDKYRSACGRSHFAWTSRDGVVVCPHCKAPIKFTEAK